MTPRHANGDDTHEPTERALNAANHRLAVRVLAFEILRNGSSLLTQCEAFERAEQIIKEESC